MNANWQRRTAAAQRAAAKIQQATMPQVKPRTKRMSADFRGQKQVRQSRFCNANINYKLPESGLISPSHQVIVQIEITNLCPRSCSNCTHLCPHQTINPNVMDFGVFQQALHSLDKHPGMIGIIGGEPTLHPCFAEFMQYAHQHCQHGRDHKQGREPIADFAKYIDSNLSDVNHRLGLWTALGPGYFRHYELIQRVFGYQCINTHECGGLHQALLIARKDMGIPDEEWYLMRDRCWIQRLWSSEINDRGAYFCEVAAAIDRLFFDGQRAWPVTADWWRRSPDQFGNQLELCEFCSVPMAVPRRPDSDQVQDVSTTTFGLLKQNTNSHATICVNAPGCLQDTYQLNCNNYLETKDGRAMRVSPKYHYLKPGRLVAVIVCVDRARQLGLTIQRNISQVDQLIVVTSSDDLETQSIVLGAGARLVVSDRCWENDDSFNKGKMLNDGVRVAKLGISDWLLFTDADIILPPTLREWFKSHVLNPGMLYYTSRYHCEPDEIPNDWTQVSKLKWRDVGADRVPSGYFQLFNPLAQALHGRNKIMSENFPTAGAVDWWFNMLWPEHCHVRIDRSQNLLGVLHIWHGAFAKQWHGRGGMKRWRLAQQTGRDRRWWKVQGGQPIQLPVEARIQRIDTEEWVIESLPDSPTLKQWQKENALIDVYVRGEMCNG